MKQIPLGKGRFAIVDDTDFEWLSDYKWGVSTSYYKGRLKSQYASCGNAKMHRMVLGEIPPGMVCDHVNQNTLDNRRENLRLATRAQSAANRGRQSNNEQGYKGVVAYVKRTRKRGEFTVYVVYTPAAAKRYGGQFKDPISAAKRYDELVRAKYGEFAATNFPNKMTHNPQCLQANGDKVQNSCCHSGKQC